MLKLRELRLVSFEIAISFQNFVLASFRLSDIHNFSFHTKNEASNRLPSPLIYNKNIFKLLIIFFYSSSWAASTSSLPQFRRHITKFRSCLKRMVWELLPF